MRSEKEMLDLIINVARGDGRIRAALLSGSRANPAAPKDCFQDYDVTYFVEDTAPFYNNISWIEEQFGRPAIMQLPELMTHPLLPPVGDGHFTYLMLFEDGNRIDLSIDSLPYIGAGEPDIVLLDKDSVIPALPAPSDACWHIKPPDEKLYLDTCNEFWWCLNNVAKGIARDELPYGMEMFNHYVRDMLNQMVDWYIGVRYDFAVSAGKMGKYYKKRLTPELYAEYVKTYSDGDYENLLASIFTCCALFRSLALEVGRSLRFAYRQDEDDAIMRYLKKVKELGNRNEK